MPANRKRRSQLDYVELVVHGITTEAWAKRWGIEIPEAVPCYDCERPQSCTLPFVHGKLRGLKAPPCECGRTRGPYCVVHSDGGDPFNDYT
jgi:hypothetical protein